MKFPKFDRFNRISGLAIALAIAASSGTAHADSPTAGQILSTYNLVTSGNVSTRSDIEGSAVIGGSLNGATFFQGNAPSTPVIDLYGTLGKGPLNLDNGGNLYYSGPIARGQVNFNGGGQHYTTITDPLSTYTDPLTQLSSTLAGLTPTAGTSIVNGTFSASGATGLIVFNLTAGQLASDLQNQQIRFSGGSGVTGYIINVSGNFSEPTSANFNTAQRDALFNFYTATNVSLGNWQTSVLAPDASLNILNGNIAGSVFAASFTGGGELHTNNLYNGALPGPSAVPETDTWAMMLIGFAMVGGMLRFRAKPDKSKVAPAAG